MDVALGIWQGSYQSQVFPWLRWFTPAGSLLPIGDERAEHERQRAERLAAKLRALGIEPDQDVDS